jgi:hypothetical protein
MFLCGEKIETDTLPIKFFRNENSKKHIDDPLRMCDGGKYCRAGS